MSIVFDNFPKRRIALSEKYQQIYTEHYKNNREGKTTASSLSQKMEGWLHRKVAADVLDDHNKSTLEIGAGTLNQLYYENTQPYDIIEPFKELYHNSPLLRKVNHIYDDIDQISPGIQYDRITSVATFEHILNLPHVVAKTCFLLKDSGSLRVAIPNEGTFLWKLGWKLTTGLEFRLKYGLDYGKLMQYEHVNTANEIEEVLRCFYNKIDASYFGLNKKVAFYRYYECRQPNSHAASEYLENTMR